MTKINYEGQEIKTKVITRIEDTLEPLKKIEALGNTARVPYDFNSSLYNEALGDVKKTVTGLENVKNDLIAASRNYEASETNCQKNNASFTGEFKIEPDEPIIRVE